MADDDLLKARLTAVYDLSCVMTLSLDVEHIAEAVLDVAGRVLELEACSLWLVDEGEGGLYRLAACGAGRGARSTRPEAGGGEKGGLYRLPLNGGRKAVVAAARRGEPLYVPDMQEDPRYVGVGAAARSELVVPLKARGRVIGVLDVESARVNAFSPDDVRLLSILAAQAGMAIENARLQAQVQREIVGCERTEEALRENEERFQRLAENVRDGQWMGEALRRRNLELAALNEIGQAITSTLDMQEALALITGHTTRLMGVAATSLLLYDEARGDLWFAAGSGAGADFVLGRRLAVGQGVAGWVVQHGEPALVPDVSRDSRWFDGFDRESGFATRSILCVPLRTRERIIGALEVINKESGPFDREDLWLLSSLAAPVATAVENARLFEEVRAGRERLQTLSRWLVEMQEAERGRVARELHDETGQILSSLLLGLSMLGLEAGQPEAVTARVAELEHLVNEMLENLHRLAMNLRPVALDYLGLAAAVEQHVEIFSRQHDLDVQFEAIGLDGERFSPAMETALYRIVQEALTNVVRHAQATRVDILLERRGDRIVVIVEDDGVGFDPEAVMQDDRLGLLGLRERAEMLGGTLVIESAAETGTTVSVEVPYAPSSEWAWKK